MANTNIVIEPNPGTLKALGKLTHINDDIKQGIRHAWFETGKDLMKEAKLQMKSQKSGKKYRNLRYKSSAPGESPRTQSGKLMKSLGWKVHGHDSMSFGYGVDKPTTKYARFMEFGSPKGQMQPRPLIQNTIKASNRDITGNLQREIIKAIE